MLKSETSVTQELLKERVLAEEHGERR